MAITGAGELDGAVAHEGVVGEVVAQPDHDLAEIDAAGHRGGLLGVGEIIAINLGPHGGNDLLLGRRRHLVSSSKSKRGPAEPPADPGV
jgi:hypothetical protein